MSMAITKKNDGVDSAKRLAVGLLQSMASLWASCTKHATRTSRKIANSASPRKLATTINRKAIQFRHKKKVGEEFEARKEKGGVWQRTILMGDKCQPLDFSGVIYYDSDGNRLSEVPVKSPRASPLPSYAYKSEKPTDRNRW